MKMDQTNSPKRISYKADLADLPFCYQFLYPETAEYFEGFLERTDERYGYCVAPDERRLTEIQNSKRGPMSDEYAEYQVALPLTSACLLESEACLFHGVAFVWQGKAWILTAPSGTGKSTQYVHWKELYGEEIQIISGDKPIIRIVNGKPVVYPSPWPGKEWFRTMDLSMRAELGGIIYLRQDQKNSIRRIPADQVAAALYLQFLADHDTKERVQQIVRLENAILSQTPVWLLSNLGDAESVRLTHDTLSSYLKEGHV